MIYMAMLLVFVAQTYYKRHLQQYNFKMKKRTPKTYYTTNWCSYNQALIKPGNISIQFDSKTQRYAQPQGEHGQNRIESIPIQQFNAVLRLNLYRIFLYEWSQVLFKALSNFTIQIGQYQIIRHFVEDKKY